MPLFGAQEGLWDIWLDDSTENGTLTRPPGTHERNRPKSTRLATYSSSNMGPGQPLAFTNHTAVYDNVG